MRIKSIKKVQSQQVHDISVMDYNTYCLPNGVICHNSGTVYASSTILTLTKAKEKDSSNEVIGVIISVTASKSRLTKENSKVKCLIRYDGGLDRYYGLLELAEEAKIFNKVSTRYELRDGSKIFGKAIMANPEKYFTKEILDELDEFCKKKFLYGAMNHDELFNEEEEEIE